MAQQKGAPAPVSDPDLVQADTSVDTVPQADSPDVPESFDYTTPDTQLDLDVGDDITQEGLPGEDELLNQERKKYKDRYLRKTQELATLRKQYEQGLVQLQAQLKALEGQQKAPDAPDYSNMSPEDIVRAIAREEAQKSGKHDTVEQLSHQMDMIRRNLEIVDARSQYRNIERYEQPLMQLSEHLESMFGSDGAKKVPVRWMMHIIAGEQARKKVGATNGTPARRPAPQQNAAIHTQGGPAQRNLQPAKVNSWAEAWEYAKKKHGGFGGAPA